jgi:hypothetical protein
LDKDRFLLIPPGEVVEFTDVVICGKRRVHWRGCTEGMGSLIVDDSGLESQSDPE